ncbi:hypothetical protein SBF1_340016 [Candidatus Desulfosporosinus infrequens]|uniref:Uncharacterized protein n=1 Tax=Candidatus Desulfosporosinus infrequens TaxID=2043169 RepID=A0A2U3L1P6_9FIRM|nr:hypothetical protein SBF1_340016 [Candidatus Desulfosporosinus infrequens]
MAASAFENNIVPISTGGGSTLEDRIGKSLGVTKGLRLINLIC